MHLHFSTLSSHHIDPILSSGLNIEGTGSIKWGTPDCPPHCSQIVSTCGVTRSVCDMVTESGGDTKEGIWKFLGWATPQKCIDISGQCSKVTNIFDLNMESSVWTCIRPICSALELSGEPVMVLFVLSRSVILVIYFFTDFFKNETSKKWC